jgi:iron complex outermembrane recepter protein
MSKLPSAVTSTSTFHEEDAGTSARTAVTAFTVHSQQTCRRRSATATTARREGPTMKIAKHAFCLTALLSVATAHAQEQVTAVDEAGQGGRLESVVVIGTRPSEATRRLAGSVDIIGRDELEYEHVDDTMELLTKVPGTYMSRFNQGIINSDISIRGFAGDGSTPHVKLLIDGIPSNLHAGYPEMDQLFPLGIGSVQVFKGTSDARYGLYNIAGSYSLASRSDVGETEIESTIGSYDAREIQAYTGLEAGKLTQNYFAGYREAGGYRDHTDLQKFVASGRWSYGLSQDTTLALIARIAGYEGDAPGYLTSAQARAAPRSSAAYASQDGGDKDTVHASVHFDSELSDAVDFSAKAYWQQFERERWVRFSAAGSVQNRFDDEQQTGLRTTLGWQMDDDWRLSVGVDAEHQRNIEQRFGTINQTRERDTANVIRNNHFEFDTRGGYVQVDHRPNEVLSWNAAVRVDRLDGDFTQISATGVRSERRMFDFGNIVQPKLNVFVAATDSITLFANYGRSFQHPFGAAAYTTGATNTRDVSINDGGEVGLRWQPTPGANVRLSYWEQRASDEFVTVDGAPRNVGETDRSGFDLAASWDLSERFALWGSYTRIDSEIAVADDSMAALVGNELRSIPDYTASLGASFQATPELTLRMSVDSQGNYFVNEANLGGEFSGYTLVGASASYRWNRWDLSLQVDNLFDEFYEYVFDFSPNGTDTIHSPGDGRNVSLSVGVRF